jgi:hypothetical protein
MMQCTIWPKGYDERQAARFAKMAHGPRKRDENGKPVAEEKKS